MREKNYDEMLDINTNNTDQFQEGRSGAARVPDSRRQGAPQINTRSGPSQGAKPST